MAHLLGGVTGAAFGFLGARTRGDDRPIKVGGLPTATAAELQKNKPPKPKISAEL